MGKRSLLSRLVASRRCARTTGMNDIVKQVVPARVVVVVVEHLSVTFYVACNIKRN